MRERRIPLAQNNRTGTARWQKIRARVLRSAIANGVSNCPLCGVLLNYEAGKTPRSPEVDHIIPWAVSQDDNPSNLRVICRRCNQSLGAKQNAKPKPKKPSVETIDFTLE